MPGEGAGVLSRPGGVGFPRPRGRPGDRAPRRRCERGARMGPVLRSRRGGVRDRDPPPRAPSRDGCRVPGARVRLGRRRGLARRGTRGHVSVDRRQRCRPGPSRSLLHGERLPVPDQPGAPAIGRVRAARSAFRSAVLAHRSRLLPGPPPASSPVGAGASDEHATPRTARGRPPRAGSSGSTADRGRLRARIATLVGVSSGRFRIGWRSCAS